VILHPALEDGVSHEVDATRDVELSHRVGFVDFYHRNLLIKTMYQSHHHCGSAVKA
jgi:hypothetical protein